MVCTKCGIDLPETFAFCPMCGKSVAKQEKKRRRRANGEGTVYKRGSTYTARVIFGYETRPDGRVKAIKRDVGGFKTMREAYAKSRKSARRASKKGRFTAWTTAKSPSKNCIKNSSSAMPSASRNPLCNAIRQRTNTTLTSTAFRLPI